MNEETLKRISDLYYYKAWPIYEYIASGHMPIWFYGNRGAEIKSALKSGEKIRIKEETPDYSKFTRRGGNYTIEIGDFNMPAGGLTLGYLEPKNVEYMGRFATIGVEGHRLSLSHPEDKFGIFEKLFLTKKLMKNWTRWEKV